MRDISLKELLEAGCHFGHQVIRQNPKAREFIFQAREGIHIIDLAKTKEGLEQAATFLKAQARKGGKIVFVGTKRQARGVVGEAAKRAGVFYVTERWIGGTLTNFDEVSKNYKKLKELRAKLADEEERAKYTKKEVGLWEKERLKLEKFYGGICDLEKLPDAIFIVDTHKEVLAVKEANRIGALVIGIVDTNADPTLVDYPIPANDDAVGSIELIVNHIADAWIEGAKEQVEHVEKVEEVEKPKRAATTKPKTKTNEKKEANEKRRSGTTKKAA